MEEEGKPSGLLFDVAKELISHFKKDGAFPIEDEPRILPWSRATKELGLINGKVMLQMARTEERENQYRWVLPTTSLSFAFVAKSPNVPNNLNEAEALDRIAVYRGSRLEAFLRQNGFNKTLVPTNDSETSARLLEGGRVQAWYASVKEALWLHKTKQLKSRPYIGRPISEVPIWAVVAPDAPVAFSDALNKQLQAMIKDGTIHRLHEKYGLVEAEIGNQKTQKSY